MENALSPKSFSVKERPDMNDEILYTASVVQSMMDKAADKGWNDAIEAAAEACDECGAMAMLVNGNDNGSGSAFSAAIRTLLKSTDD